MSNMSYCRFQNTLNDLRECLESIYEEESVSKDEHRARTAMIEEMSNFAFHIGFDIDEDDTLETFAKDLPHE